jgi:hypothetical protein
VRIIAAPKQDVGSGSIDLDVGGEHLDQRCGRCWCHDRGQGHTRYRLHGRRRNGGRCCEHAREQISRTAGVADEAVWETDLELAIKAQEQLSPAETVEADVAIETAVEIEC